MSLALRTAAESAARIAERCGRSSTRFAVHATGAFGSLVQTLLQTPGISAGLVSANVAYSTASSLGLRKLCGDGVDASAKSVSAQVALELAESALRVAVRDGWDKAQTPAWVEAVASSECIGIGATAAVASSRPRHGHHHCFLAACTSERSRVWYVRLAKGERSREEEDAELSRYAMFILESCVRADSELAPVSGLRVGALPPIGHRDDAVPTEQLLLVADHARAPPLRALLDGILEAAPPGSGAASGPTPLAREFVADLPARAPLAVFTRAAGGEACAAGASAAPSPRFVATNHVPLSQCVVLPGSFNPLHKAHIAAAVRAAEHAAALALVPSPAHSSGARELPQIVFELSALNADKPPIPEAEVASRVAQFFAASGEDEAARGEQAGARPSDAPGEAATAEEFESSVARAASATAMFVEHDASGAAAPAAALHAAVAVTRAPLFRDKAALFPGSWMVVGADTAARLVMDKYYGGSRDAMLAALLSIRGQGCGFLVVGRSDTRDGSFVTLRDLAIPEVLRDMFVEVPDFRMDLSSTDIRRQRELGQR